MSDTARKYLWNRARLAVLTAFVSLSLQTEIIVQESQIYVWDERVEN